jgi:hypothetical protein
MHRSVILQGSSEKIHPNGFFFLCASWTKKIKKGGNFFIAVVVQTVWTTKQSYNRMTVMIVVGSRRKCWEMGGRC